MDLRNHISGFFTAIQNDGRICCAHIGLYATLLHLWQQRGFVSPILIYSHEIMPIARISSRATYHRCIRDLHDFGYLDYRPSFNKKRQSEIYLNETCKSAK